MAPGNTQLSPITFHSMYGGEDYDARLEQKGWNTPGFNDSGWHNAVVQRAPKGLLTPQMAPPVKIMEHFGVKSTHKLTPEEVEKASVSTKRKVDPSAILLDMGQNLSGFPQITVQGKAGQKITMLVAEGITPENAANQKQTGRQHIYTYTLKGMVPKPGIRVSPTTVSVTSSSREQCLPVSLILRDYLLSRISSHVSSTIQPPRSVLLSAPALC